MRHSLTIFAAFVLVAAGALALRAQDAAKPAAPAAPAPAGLETLEKRVAYALGFNLGQNLHQQGASIDADALARGMRDGLAGTAPVLSESDMQKAMMEFQMELQKKQGAQAEKNKAAGIAFLEKNKTAEGVKVTKSGLQYKVVREGQGERPTPRDTVVVHYEGTLVDGQVFDSSYKRGAPLTFEVGGVIPGWTEGLQLMTPGSTYMFFIPSELAYGANPPPGIIGPDAVLVFKVELLEVKKAK